MHQTRCRTLSLSINMSTTLKTKHTHTHTHTHTHLVVRYGFYECYRIIKPYKVRVTNISISYLFLSMTPISKSFCGAAHPTLVISRWRLKKPSCRTVVGRVAWKEKLSELMYQTELSTLE